MGLENRSADQLGVQTYAHKTNAHRTNAHKIIDHRTNAHNTIWNTDKCWHAQAFC